MFISQPSLHQTRTAEKQLKIEKLATKFLDVTNALKTDLANEIDSIKILLKIKTRDHTKALLRFDAKYRNFPFPISADNINPASYESSPDEYFGTKVPTANDVGNVVCGNLIDSASDAWQTMVTKVEPLAKELVEGINVIVQELLQFIEMQDKPDTCNKTVTALQVILSLNYLLT